MTLLETLLAGRYKILEIVKNDGLSNTYIAEDTRQIGSPKCIVKQLIGGGDDRQKSYSSHSSHSSPSPMRSARRIFSKQVQIFNKLANCDRVPQLWGSFKENQDFYLVQELVIGQPLSEELLLGQPWGKPGTVWQCVEILKEALVILELIHDRGVIHCNLKPENFIRRTRDGRLIPINFSGAKEVLKSQTQGQLSIAVPIGTFGYVSPEQLAGNSQPNSDVYALGLIGIQALTGLHPSLLEINAVTGELSWERHAQIPPGDEIIFILNKMVRAHSKQRYQSAREVLEALEAYSPLESPPPLTVHSIRISEELREDFIEKNITDGENGEKSEKYENYERILPLALEDGDRLSLSLAPAPEGLAENEAFVELENALSSEKTIAKKKNKKLSALKLGAGAGMALNAVTIIAALHSLFYSVPIDTGINALSQAKNQYQSGQLQEAIALVKSIRWDSSVYEQAQLEVERWEVEWNKASAKFEKLEAAFQEQQWQNVLSYAGQLPSISYWQNKSDPMVQKAAQEMAPAARELLQQAHQQASNKNFAAAIGFLEKIPFGTPVYETARSQMALYEEQLQLQREVQAHRLLQKAYDRAVAKDFTGALKFLQDIPQGTSTYEKVQAKISEYTKKQNIKANRLLQGAYDRAIVGNYSGAISLLRKIPSGTSAYAIGQAKIAEYNQVLYRASQSRRARQTRRTRRTRQTRRRRGRRVSSAISSPSFNPGDMLQETNPSGLS